MKYLTALALLFLVGCSSNSGGGSSSRLLGGGYTDYQATAADGTTKVHRIYSNGHQEWLTASEAAAK